MTNDELNVLRGIIERRGEVKAGDEFGDVVAVTTRNGCQLNPSIRCIFGRAAGIDPCPSRIVEARVVLSCTTGSSHVKKELVFVPKVEYLTWKLTKA